MKKKPIRIDLRLDPEKDKDILDFLDENGKTRVGFIREILKDLSNDRGVTSLKTTEIDYLNEMKALIEKLENKKSDPSQTTTLPDQPVSQKRKKLNLNNNTSF